MRSHSARIARRAATLFTVAAVAATLTAPAVARDRPFGAAQLNAFFKISRLSPVTLDNEGRGMAGSMPSKQQINRFTCTAAGNPATWVDVSCNDTTHGQDFAPDNEVAVAVDPNHPGHILVGSNDYFYRFNNSTGARQAIVVTGFATSFDDGATWLDGQVPVRSGSGAGDPAPAFVGRLGEGRPANQAVALMAQLENAGGQGGCCVSQGDVSVSRSVDGGVTWSPPITVFKGQGTGIGPANQATFFDKEWLTVDNSPDSPFYGRAYLTATRFLGGIHGSYSESAIYFSYSDDGGQTWTAPAEISGSHPSCTYQETGGGTECDEDQFSIPVTGPDGTLYVHFANFQNEAAWEATDAFDSQLMIVRSTDGGQTFGAPVQVAQLEDGLADMPFSVLGRQTVWGHQIRWAPYGNITVDPTDPTHVTVVWADRGTPNPNATPGCIDTPATAPDYDPCDAGPGSDLNVYRSDSTDGGLSWGRRTLVDAAGGAAQWFPWAGYLSDGTLVAAWDEDLTPAPADAFVHVLWREGAASEPLGPIEQVDISLTHWTGQYVPESSWPTICGPAGYSDPPVTDAEGKDCNAFHGDYTGLAVGSDDAIHVTWTGLNALATSPQLDFYTGAAHDGYRQDAMYAQR